MGYRILHRGSRALGLALLFAALGRLPLGAQSEAGNVPIPWLQAIGAVPTMMDAPLLVDLSGMSGFDSNIFDSNRNPIGSEFMEAGVHASYQQEAWMERERANLVYDGNALMYPGHSGNNQADHALAFTGELEPTPRWVLRLRDNFYYQSGLFAIAPPTPAASVTVEPLGENPSVVTPFARQWTDNGRMDASYATGPRASVDLFGSYGVHRFSNVSDSAQLYNSRDAEAGASYVYRLSRNWWAGPTVSEEDLGFGSLARARLFTASGSVTWQATPALVLTAFGGGQHIALHQEFEETLLGADFSASVDEHNWHPQLGGSVQRTWDWVRATFSGQKSITDGGGLLTTVTNDYQQLELRVPGASDAYLDWNVSLLLSNGTSTSLASGEGASSLSDQRLGIQYQRWLADQWNITIAESLVRQRAQGLPQFNNATRNLFSVGVTYRLVGPSGRM